MKKGKNLFILCSAAFCFTLALAGCQNANQTVVPSESETSESQSGQETTTYTVKFNSNGGSAVADQKVKKGEKAKKPTDPTREGYSFVNWFEDSALATVFDFNQVIVSDLTLYAKWDRNGDPGPGPQPEEYDYYFVCGTTKVGLIADSGTLDTNQTGQWSKSGVSVTAGQEIQFLNASNTAVQAGSDYEDATNKNNVNGNYEDGYTIHNDATDVYVTLKSWQDGGYSFWITGYEASTLDPTVPYGPEGSELVSWYIVGQGSLWEWSWDIDTSVQLYSNPNSSTDLGCILNVTFAVNDLFKVTDGETWYGYDKVDPWDVPGNMGLHAFDGAPDGFQGQNFCCTTAGTYDIYVKGDGTFWIQAHS